MLELRYYLAGDGKSPFEEWFSGLRCGGGGQGGGCLARLEQGNVSNVKTVGEGVLEYRIDWGPGYRVYFGRDGDVLVILLTGGTKQRQQNDIEAAKEVGGLQAATTTGKIMEADMALTKSFKELVQRRVADDFEFADALLREGIDTMLTGDVETGKAILRDYIKATVGFEKLGAATDTPPKS